MEFADALVEKSAYRDAGQAGIVSAGSLNHGHGMQSSLVDMRGIGKSYSRAAQRIDALRDFSLSLSAGEVLGLLGPNGAGKTTAVKILATLVEPDAGEILWRGAPAAGKRHLREVGVLLEGRGAVNERLSTRENARYFCGLRETRFDPKHFAALTALLDLPDADAPVRLLSTGNKLKSALLLSLVHRPAVVFLDEPTIGLDVFGVDRLESLVRHAAEHGTAVMISSHDLHFIERLAHRIVCICRGRKVFDGSKEEFLHVEHAYVLTLHMPDDRPPGLPRLRTGLDWEEAAPGEYRVRLRDHGELCAVLPALQPRLHAARAMQVERVTLKDKYLNLVDAARKEAA